MVSKSPITLELKSENGVFHLHCIDVLTSFELNSECDVALMVGPQKIRTVSSKEWFFKDVKEFVLYPITDYKICIILSDKDCKTIYVSGFQVNCKDICYIPTLFPQWYIERGDKVCVDFKDEKGPNRFLIWKGLAGVQYLH